MTRPTACSFILIRPFVCNDIKVSLLRIATARVWVGEGDSFGRAALGTRHVQVHVQGTQER